MRQVVVAVAVAGLAACHAQLQDGDVDAQGGRDARIDALPDSRACVGGDGHVTDPDGNCFTFFSAAPKTFVDAKAACAAMSGHLAKITTTAQNTMIAALTHGFDTFIGLSDRTIEMTFVWDDGTPLVYDNFRAGVPNNGGNTYQEDCVVIEGKKTPDDTWDDRPCDGSEIPTSGSYAYLCQY